MATHVSPGVYSKIIDLSEYLTSTSGTIGFVPIITEKGPDNVLTKISSIEEYRTKFGDPNLKTFGKYYGQGPYVALNHLEVSSDLYVLRALPDDAVYAHSFVAFSKTEQTALDVNSSTVEASDVNAGSTQEAQNINNGDAKVELVTFNVYKESIAIPGGYLHFSDMTDTQKLDTYFTSAMDAQIAYKVPNICTDAYSKNACDGVLMYVRAFGRGDYYNGLSYLLRADSNPNNFGIYTFEVYQDQDDTPVLVESYNVTFDPESLDADGESNYIENVVNKYSTLVQVQVNENSLRIMKSLLFDFYKNDPTIEETQPDYVVTNVVGTEEYTGFPTSWTDRTTGTTYSMIPTYYGEDDLGCVTPTFPAEAGIYVGKTLIENPEEIEKPENLVTDKYILGTKAIAIWRAYWQKALAKKATVLAAKQYKEAIEMQEDQVTDGTTVQQSREEAIDAAIEAVTQAQTLTDEAQLQYDNAVAMSLMHLSDSNDEMYGDQPYYLMNGSLGSLVYTKAGKRVIQSSVANQTLCNAYSGLLKKPIVVRKVDESTGNVTFKVQYCNDVLDLDWIYFSIVYDAGYKPDVKQMAKELVETRMDCVLISDCGDNSDCEDVELYTGAVKGATDCRIWNSFYCARYEPYTRVYDQYNGCDQWLSPVYTMAKLIPQNDALYNLWYAPAGFNRGVSSEIKELRWSANLGERDRLYSAQVNPIVYFPEGMTVWGQLTTQKKTSTLSDLNCVRTVLYIKRAIEQFCRNFIFEFNDSVTHDNIKNGISPILAEIQANRGLKSYSIDVGATDYEYKRKTCHVNVTLAPMKVIEQIQLNLYIE